MRPPANPFAPFLERQGFVLLDGGLATTLEARGHDLNDPLWSARVLLDAPEEVAAVHTLFLEAGADCIATCTYQATHPGLARRGLSAEEADALLHQAVTLATGARDAFWVRLADGGGSHRSEAPRGSGGPDAPRRLRPLVAASVGPYGAFLADGSEYRGRYGLTADQLADFHRRRWAVLARSAADLLACETIPDLNEVRALRRLLEETPDIWAWISLQCADEARLADGTPLEEVVDALRGTPRLAAVGVNCVPPGRVAGVLKRLAGASIPVLAAYPNSGEGYDPNRKAWTGERDDTALAEYVPTWLAAGARLLGGCCRVGPDGVFALRRAASASLPASLETE